MAPKRKKPEKHRETIYFSDRAHEALLRLHAKYPDRILSEIVSGAVAYLEKQSQEAGLDANCEPVNLALYVEQFTEKMHAIAAEEAAKYAKDGPTKEKRRANDRQH